jgi:hypothetical protein
LNEIENFFLKWIRQLQRIQVNFFIKCHNSVSVIQSIVKTPFLSATDFMQSRFWRHARLKSLMHGGHRGGLQPDAETEREHRIIWKNLRFLRQYLKKALSLRLIAKLELGVPRLALFSPDPSLRRHQQLFALSEAAAADDVHDDDRGNHASFFLRHLRKVSNHQPITPPTPSAPNHPPELNDSNSFWLPERYRTTG